MNKPFYLFSLFIFVTQLLFAQGGRLTAMGNNGAAVKDIWGTAANPAAIGNIKLPTLHISYENYSFANELRSEAMAFVFPNKRFSFGLSLQRYGIPEFHTLQTGLVFTKQFGPDFSIGLRTNYHQIHIRNYGTTTGISLDIGTFYQLSEEVALGFYFNNPLKQAYFTKAINITIPTSAYLGIAYKTSSKFLLASTLSKELHLPWNVAFGMDYQISSSLSMRSGISLMPYKLHFGIGFNLQHFNIDFTLTTQSDIGYSPQITIGYVF